MAKLNEEKIREIVREETQRAIRNELNQFFEVIALNLLGKWGQNDKHIKDIKE
jgi:hypothetical protein